MISAVELFLISFGLAYYLATTGAGALVMHRSGGWARGARPRPPAAIAPEGRPGRRPWAGRAGTRPGKDEQVIGCFLAIDATTTPGYGFIAI
jgi:hypothetical protein